MMMKTMTMTTKTKRNLRTATAWMIGTMAGAFIAAAAAAESPYARWERGPSADPTHFPIAVWLQNPARAAEYKAIGINTYVGLWRGPTEAQLAELKRHGMRVICDQNEIGLAHLEDPVIAGWMHGDEPDNAQPDGRGGYGPPIEPARIIADYERLHARDPSRPVLLNLGQGVAWDGWYGRGTRTNHPEDYPEYVKGGDIVSFDIYPVNSAHPDVQDKLWLVPFGMDRLNEWSADNQALWTCIECTQIGSTGRRPTPHEVRAEVWMSLIHGSQGLIYFVHEFEIKDDAGAVTRPFTEAGLLRDREMAAAVGAINRQITELAPVLNEPPPASQPVAVESADTDIPIVSMSRTHQGAHYVFAAAARPGLTTATFRLQDGTPVSAQAQVLGEDRTLPIEDRSFTDTFESHDVHLYKITASETMAGLESAR